MKQINKDRLKACGGAVVLTAAMLVSPKIGRAVSKEVKNERCMMTDHSYQECPITRDFNGHRGLEHQIKKIFEENSEGQYSVDVYYNIQFDNIQEVIPIIEEPKSYDNIPDDYFFQSDIYIGVNPQDKSDIVPVNNFYNNTDELAETLAKDGYELIHVDNALVKGDASVSIHTIIGYGLNTYEYYLNYRTDDNTHKFARERSR